MKIDAAYLEQELKLRMSPQVQLQQAYLNLQKNIYEVTRRDVDKNDF